MPGSKIEQGNNVSSEVAQTRLRQTAQPNIRKTAESLSSILRLNTNAIDIHAKQSQVAIKAALENSGLVENRKLQITRINGGHPKLSKGVASSALRSAKLESLKLEQKETILVENFGQKVSVGVTAENLKVPALIKTQATSNQNMHSTHYHRDDYTRIKQLIEDIVEHPAVKQSISLNIPVCEDRFGMFVRLVGSADFAQRYNLFFNSYLPLNSGGAVQFRIADGVHALLIPYHDGLLEKLPEYCNRTQLDSIYHYLGGPPSVGALKNAIHALSQNRVAQPFISPGKTETASDTSLLKSLSLLKSTLRNMRPDTALLGEIALSLVNDLIESKLEVNQHQASKDIYRQVSNYLTGISQSHENFGLCHELLDSIFEEVNLLLNLSKPYKLQEAHLLQQEIYCKELTCLNHIKNVNILSRAFTGSGMQAIGVALEHVINLQKSQNRFHGIRQLSEQGPNYYEVPLLVNALLTEQPSSLILANLNPSSWVANRQPHQIANEVLNAVKKFAVKDKPVYLLMDTTIDSGNGDLNAVVGRLLEPLKTGKLCIYLCKSYQKYPAFGSGKISMGNVTELGARNVSTAFNLKSMLASSEHFHNSNGQFLTHLLRNNHLSIKVIKAAADNARFVSQFCWPVTHRDPAKYMTAVMNGSTALDDLPFLFRSGNPDRGTLYLMATQGVKSRLTFGFLESSICPIGYEYRINTGIESRERLVEQFFATGQILGRTDFFEPALEAIEQLTTPTATETLLAQEAGFSTQNSAITACDFFYTDPKNGTRLKTVKFIQQYEANIKASILLLSYAYDLSGIPITQNALHETKKLIDSQFKGKAPGSCTVSIQARQSLLENYLSREFEYLDLHQLNETIASDFCRLIDQCNSTTRLGLLCESLPDSFFRETANRLEQICRDTVIEALMKNIQPDLLAEAAHLRLMKHSSNDGSVGINLARIIANRLEKTLNCPALLPDLMEDDFQEISRSVRDKEILAFNKLKGAIQLHVTLESR
ncbi:MAG: hypothetical protein LW710_01370 [Burkholderiales bacterium]|jgi:hypothetical protein|uniref:hypothetical protein n=1 Tax=Limnobacter sp. TaxID=2003368 RepID=UPI0039BCDBB2|nr:hypothetical protein [Burkholderiales bacterium]